MLPQPQHRAVLRRGLFEIPLHELEVCLHQPCVLHHVAPGNFFIFLRSSWSSGIFVLWCSAVMSAMCRHREAPMFRYLAMIRPLQCACFCLPASAAIRDDLVGACLSQDELHCHRDL